jgi:hypothetical protein
MTKQPVKPTAAEARLWQELTTRPLVDEDVKRLSTLAAGLGRPMPTLTRFELNPPGWFERNQWPPSPPKP